ncbi:MAG: ribosome recycling factor [Clostridiales bacterium]|nr:ribosome recycling factor [Clostridiales bacterium]
MLKEEYKSAEEKMKKTVLVLKDTLKRMRAGRANVSVLDKISVPYYGTPTPINQVANVTIPEARVISIQPWDSSLLKEIEKAILKSDIGITPNNDGKILRLLFPALTEERRIELTKEIKKEGEDSKVAIRSIRRDTMDKMKNKKKDGEVTEDELKVAEKDVQNLTDKYVSEVDNIVKAKESEVLEV